MRYIDYSPGYHRDGSHLPYWTVSDGKEVLALPVDHGTLLIIDAESLDFVTDVLTDARYVRNTDPEFRTKLNYGPVRISE